MKAYIKDTLESLTNQQISPEEAYRRTRNKEYQVHYTLGMGSTRVYTLFRLDLKAMIEGKKNFNEVENKWRQPTW